MTKLLLISKEASFLVDTAQKKFSSQYGIIDLTKTKIGKTIKSSSGHVFAVVEPTILDYIKKFRRGPQVVLPKDAAQIIAITGARNGWQCLDAGGGSGFLALFIANIVQPGKMTAYEKKKEFAKNIEHNAKLCGLKNVVVKNKDAGSFTEKNLNLITLDMQGAEKIIKKCHKVLKPGGWLCIYSPHIEQQKRVVKEMKDFIQMRTIECVVRDWKIDLRGFTHPKYSEISHTGFMTFGRKI